MVRFGPGQKPDPDAAFKKVPVLKVIYLAFLLFSVPGPQIFDRNIFMIQILFYENLSSLIRIPVANFILIKPDPEMQLNKGSS